MFETPITPSVTTEELLDARKKFEAEKLTRRAALKKFGITTGMAVFGMFAADDLARMVIKKMEETEATRQIAETVAHEFKNSGIAFADSSYDVCSDCTADCTPDLDFDCVDCTETMYSSCIWPFSKPKKKVAKMPASCANSNGTKANCEACEEDCLVMCQKKNTGAAISKCSEVQVSACHAYCDLGQPDDGGSNIWNCWKKYC